MSGPAGDPAALFGFTAGDVSREAVLAQLHTLFGPDAAHPVELTCHDWSREEHTSPPGVARLVDTTLFGHPLFQRPALGGRLHWASTETGSAFPGHIEGALVAAERAARAILEPGRADGGSLP